MSESPEDIVTLRKYADDLQWFADKLRLLATQAQTQEAFIKLVTEAIGADREAYVVYTTIAQALGIDVTQYDDVDDDDEEFD